MNEAVAAAQALARDDDFWLPDQFSNPANPDAHYRGTGPELWEALDGEIDCLVAGVGTGGTITGAGRFLKERNPKLRVVARRARLLAGALRRAPRAAQDPGHRRGLRPAGARPRPARRGDRRRRRGRAGDRARWSRAARACSPASRAAPRCAGAMQVAEREEARGGGSRSCCPTPASATSRRRSSPPSRPRRRASDAARDRRAPPGAPWERPLRGTLDRLVVESERLAGNPLGDPATRPLWVYSRARRRRRAGADRLRDPGLPRPGRLVGEPHPVRADDARARRRDVRERRLPAGARRVRRRVDELRRLAVPQLVEHRARTWTTCATRSCRSSTSATRRCPGPSTAG